MYENERQVKDIVLTAVTTCAVCGHTYAVNDVTIIGNHGDLWMMLLHCSNCTRRGVIAALVNGPDTVSLLPSPEGMAEPTSDKATPAEPVGDEDVRAMRAFLADFSGNLASYLRRGDEE
jgi:hypothetical protein